MSIRFLTADDAACILFGTETLLDPDFDPSSEQFRSGADIAEDLAAHFNLTDEDYLRCAAWVREREPLRRRIREREQASRVSGGES